MRIYQTALAALGSLTLSGCMVAPPLAPNYKNETTERVCVTPALPPTSETSTSIIIRTDAEPRVRYVTPTMVLRAQLEAEKRLQANIDDLSTIVNQDVLSNTQFVKELYKGLTHLRDVYAEQAKAVAAELSVHATGLEQAELERNAIRATYARMEQHIEELLKTQKTLTTGQTTQQEQLSDFRRSYFGEDGIRDLTTKLEQEYKTAVSELLDELGSQLGRIHEQLERENADRSTNLLDRMNALERTLQQTTEELQRVSTAYDDHLQSSATALPATTVETSNSMFYALLSLGVLAGALLIYAGVSKYKQRKQEGAEE